MEKHQSVTSYLSFAKLRRHTKINGATRPSHTTFISSISKSLRRLSAFALLSVCAAPAFGLGESVGMIDVSLEPGVYRNSTTAQDSSDGINDAIEYARDFDNGPGKPKGKPLFFPSGTYYVGKPIVAIGNPNNLAGKCGSHDGNQTIQLIGQATGSRPLIRLKNSSTPFASAATPTPIVEIRHYESNVPDCAFRHVFRGIDINVGTGNPKAVGLHFDAAQNSLLEDVKITASGGYDGITGVPGRNMAATNIEVVGGRRGFSLDGTSLGTVLVGLKLTGQTNEALYLNVTRAISVIGVEITKNIGTGPAIRLGAAYEEAGHMSLIDARIDMQVGGPAINNDPLGRFIALTNVYVRNAPTIVDTSNSTALDPDDLEGSTGWTRVDEYTYTPATFNSSSGGIQASNLVNGTLNNTTAKVTVQVASAPTDLVSRNVWASTPSFQTSGVVFATNSIYAGGATPNDTNDDTAAIQAALNSSPTAKVYLPAGTYIISSSLTLGADDTLMGVPGYRSVLERALTWNPANRDWIIETASSAVGSALLQDIAIDNDDDTLVGGIRWQVGRNSMVRGVRTYLESNRDEIHPAHVYRIEGNGGGRWYSLSEHINIKDADTAVSPGFRKLYVTGTTEPLTFYGLNLERGGRLIDAPQYAYAEMINASNVRILGTKMESDGIVFIFNNCKNLFAAMLFANKNTVEPVPLIDLIGTGNTPVLMHGVYWPGSTVELVRDDFSGDQITRDRFLGVYKRGTVNHSVWRIISTTPGFVDHNIIRTSATLAIDGVAESAWNLARPMAITNVLDVVSGGSDLSGTFKTLWDATNLYVLVNVTDDTQVNDSGTARYNDDGIEIYVDANNEKSTIYVSTDVQYIFAWNGASLAEEAYSPAPSMLTGVTSTRTALTGSYVIEVRIPWSTLGQSSVTVGAFTGIDVHINDDDNGGTRDGKLMWHDTTDTAYQSPSVFGTGQLLP